MKNKRFAKVALLLLTAALLIGAVVGFSVSAEGETTVAIAEKAVSYDGALQVVYYVDAANFDSETDTLKMDFWTPVKAEGQRPSYTQEFDPANKVEKDGKVYYAFYSNGVNPVDMTKPIYAEAYVVAQDGTELARSEAAEYSVYAYSMDCFSADPTADQVKLYRAQLDYSAAVQAIFPADANTETYGWADAYYDITTNVFVDGALDASSVTSSKPARPSELAAFADGEYVLAYANSTVESAIFRGIFDEDGAAYASPFALPGKHSYNINYTNKGNLNDFEGLTDVNALFEGGKYEQPGNPNYGSGDMYIDGTIGNGLNRTDIVKYIAFENGTGKNGAASNYIVTGTSNKNGMAWKIDANDGSNVKPGVGVTYIIDFDFKVNELVYEGTDYARIAYMGINSVIGNFNSNGGSSANFIDFDLYATAAGENQTVNFANTTGMAMVKGEWYDIRVEYVIVSLDDPATADVNEANAIVRYYRNGVLADTKTTTDIATPESFYFGPQNNVASSKYSIDNLYIGTFGAENQKGAGKYYTGAATSTNSVSYNFDGLTSVDALLGKYATTVLNDTTAKNYLAVVDGELVAGTNGDSANAWGWWALKGASNEDNDGEIGTKYVLEMDFKYGGGIGRESDQRLSYSFGMNSKNEPADSSTTFAGYRLYDGGNGMLNFGSATDPAFQMNAGKWYNLLFEYEITANGFKVMGSTSYDGKLNVYLNGELVATKNVENSTDVISAFETFYFEHNGTDTKYFFDNIYMGITPLEGNKGTGTYYNKYLANELVTPTVWDFNDDVQITNNQQIVDSNNGYKLNDYRPHPGTGTYYDDRHVVLTGAHAMKIGSDKSWEQLSINAKNIALEVGETGVFETDFLFLGSAAQVSHLAEFYITNKDSNQGSVIASLSPCQGSASDGTSVKLKSSNGPELFKNTWYNIRVEITRTEAGADVVYYLDGVEFAKDSSTNDASVIYGAYWTSRVSGAEYQGFLFDNIVFANISKEKNPDEVVYESYYEALKAGEKSWNGMYFINNKVVDFDAVDKLSKGEAGSEDILYKDTSATLNATKDKADGPYVNVTDGALNFGYAGAIDITDGAYNNNNYSIDVNGDLTATAGQIFVVEYDFTANSVLWDINAQGKKHLVFNTNLYTSASSTMFNIQFMRTAQNAETGEIPAEQPVLGSAQFQTGVSPLTVGKTYKLRMEVTVVDEKNSSVSYYIDNTLIYTESRTPTNLLELGRLRFQIHALAAQDYTIDNLVFAVVQTTDPNGGEVEPPVHEHTWTETVDEKFLASEATTEAAATYYKSCECGEKSTETFSHGDPLPPVVTPTYEKGNGVYFKGDKTTSTNVSYNFDAVTDVSNLIGKSSGTVLNSTTADNYLAVVNGELVAGTSDFVDTAGAGGWGWWTLKGVDNSENNAEIGTKYVLEMDFKYGGGTGRSSDSRLSYSIGMNSLLQPKDSGTTFAGYKLFDGGNNVLNANSNSSPIFSIEADKWYNILFEYEIVSNGYKVDNSTVWTGTLNVYINGNLVDTRASKSQTPDINKTFESFFFEHNGISTKYIFDNIYMGITTAAGEKGTGVYYNKATHNELVNPTVWDFDEDTALTDGSQVIKGTYTLNNRVTTAASSGDRYMLVTGAKSLAIGAISTWSEGYINGNNVALAVGETGVFETDFLFAGSDAQTAYMAEFYVRNGGKSSLASMSIYPGSAADGTSVKLKSTSGPELFKNTWYNIRVEITRTETGADVVYYLNGTQFAKDTTDKDASVIYGAYWTSRVAGAMNQCFLFDNIVFANASKVNDPSAVTYDNYYDAAANGATSHNGKYFVNTHVVDFDAITSLTKGEAGTDNVLYKDTQATLNAAGDEKGPYVNVTNGALNFGYTDTIVNGDGAYGQTNYCVDINGDIKATAGQTYIVEYDFTVNNATWDIDAQGKKHQIFNMNLYTSASSTMFNIVGNRSGQDKDTGIIGALQPVVGSNQTQPTALTIGKTYKVRVEMTVEADGKSNVSYYIDDALIDAATEVKTPNTLGELGRLRFQLHNLADQHYTIDNLVFAVVQDSPAE